MSITAKMPGKVTIPVTFWKIANADLKWSAMDKKPLLQLLSKIGLFPFAKFLTRDSPKILMYHRFGVANSERRLGSKTFENQLKILKREFRVLSLKHLVQEIKSNGKSHPNTVSITIDDGYSDFYAYAFPLLQKHGLPATLFVTTNFIDGKMWQWPDLIEYTLSRTERVNVSCSIHGNKREWWLGTARARFDAWNGISDYCLTLKEEDRLKLLTNMAEQLKVNVPDKPVDDYKALSWVELREMHEKGIEIGSHTCTHARLTLASLGELRNELALSKSRIESMLSESVFSFCYPYGRAEDFNEEIVGLVRDAGYKTAVTAYHDPTEPVDFYRLGRYGVGVDSFEFKKKVYGVERLGQLFS